MIRAVRRSTTVALCAAMAAACGAPQRQDLPPITFICPMPEHAYVLEDKAGTCPICKMPLVPVRIEQTFTCPRHPEVVSDRPGDCPVDQRELLPVIVNLYWTCPETPAEHLTEPGACADGALRTAVRESRAHGDHNPRHGGQFFMAADKWHHLEATHPSPGVVRVYFYDNFTKGILPSGFSGRIETKENADVAPLGPSPAGNALETRLNVKTLPLTVAVKIAFGPELPEEHFDVTFSTYSKEQPTAPPAGRIQRDPGSRVP